MADESAKIRIEAGQTENAKPLYFHPITIGNAEGYPAFKCSIIVINNDKAPIDTWTKLTNFFNQVFDLLPEGVSVARFPATGFVKNSSKTIVSSVIEITGKTDTTRTFIGVNVSASSLDSMTASDISGAPSVADGVNKVN